MGGEVDDAARNAPSGLLTEDDLAQAAHRLWPRLERGAVLWLSGDLGSGKTTFVQHLCRAAGGEDATSPTYALVQQYATPEGPVQHVDCYRLRDPAEALDLDLEAMRRDARLMCVEWPEQADGYLPRPDLHLRFRHADRPDRRRVEVVT